MFKDIVCWNIKSAKMLICSSDSTDSAQKALVSQETVSATVAVYTKIKVDFQLKGLNMYFYSGDSELVSIWSFVSYSVILI